MGWRKLAFLDEVAQLTSTVVPSDVSTSPSIGSSNESARADHVHALADGVVTTSKIADGAVTTSKINIDADLNFNEKEIDAVAIDVVSSLPSTNKVGRIVFLTDDNHYYVYTP
ncbi:MAG: hypothetical protein QW734_04630 [Candidatus Bathyarchaeia archaeon]